MFVPQLRISARIVVALLFGTTTTAFADELLPPVISSGPAKILSASASKPQAVKDPRVFSSGPVLSPEPPIPMSIPMADEAPMSLPEPNPFEAPAIIEPEAPTELPDTQLSTVGHQQVPEVPDVPAETTTVLNPPLEQYYQPYSSPIVYHTTPEPMARDWASLEALVWWTSKTDLPVLATTSPNTTPINQAGVLGNDTQVLFGGDHAFGDASGGFRLRLGHFFNECDGSGLTGEFFMLASRGHDFHASSAGEPVIARPFFNTNLNAPDSQLIAYPGQYRGSLNINAETKMYSLAAHYWGELYIDRSCDCDGCTDGGCTFVDGCNQRDCDETQFGIKIGPRFMHLDDSILIDETAIKLDTGGRFHLQDSFKTENSFLGGEIGLKARRNRGPFDVELGLQLAIGATRQELDISGINTATTGQGVSTTTPGGFLALDSNSGSWDRNRFSLIPGLDVSVGYELKNGWRATVGYNLLYWTSVLRASEQIDPTMNTDKLQPVIAPSSSTERPSVPFKEADYLAHGISFGLEKRW